MTNERGTDGVSEEVSNSPEGTEESVAELQSKIEELKQEREEYESRIGTLVRDKGTTQKQYQDWSTNLNRFYEEQAELTKDTIVSLESQLMEVSDLEGAQAVLKARTEREKAEKDAQQERAALLVNQQQELQSAIAEAAETFDIDPTELASATTSKQANSMAAKKRREIDKQELKDLVSAMTPTSTANEEDTRDEEVAGEEENSRTPAASRGTTSKRGSVDDAVAARVAELEGALKDAQKKKQLAVALAVGFELRKFKADNGLD